MNHREEFKLTAEKFLLAYVLHKVITAYWSWFSFILMCAFNFFPKKHLYRHASKFYILIFCIFKKYKKHRNSDI